MAEFRLAHWTTDKSIHPVMALIVTLLSLKATIFPLGITVLHMKKQQSVQLMSCAFHKIHESFFHLLIFGKLFKVNIIWRIEWSLNTISSCLEWEVVGPIIADSSVIAMIIDYSTQTLFPAGSSFPAFDFNLVNADLFVSRDFKHSNWTISALHVVLGIRLKTFFLWSFQV